MKITGGRYWNKELTRF